MLLQFPFRRRGFYANAQNALLRYAKSDSVRDVIERVRDWCAARQMQQVLLNLVMNGMDALESCEDELRLAVQRVELEAITGEHCINARLESHLGSRTSVRDVR